jgi:hypothetical protein
MQATPQKLSYMGLAAAAIFLLAQISETVRGSYFSAFLSLRTVVHSLKLLNSFLIYIQFRNIKMRFKGTGEKYILLTQDQWQALVNIEMNLQVS